MMGILLNLCGHFTMYVNQSCSTPETYVLMYVSYFSRKLEKEGF